ncbi:MAG: hypothetical protein IT539_04035 [Bradyrhizobiaceae bacterium]|nr:hypothetical protein [Bradyrhizobiaceae bacterium]
MRLAAAPLLALAFALAFALALPAHAQEQKEPDPDLNIGAGLVCNTKQQVERYVELFQGDAKEAAEAVNREAGEPDACTFGVVAFKRGADVTPKLAKDNEMVQVAEILVFGIGTDAGMVQIEPQRWYTLLPAEGVQI